MPQDTIPIANPSDCESLRDQRGPEGPLWLLNFGAYGETAVYCWASCVDDAFEHAVEWLDDNAPGHLCDVSTDDLKESASELGIAWDVSWETEPTDSDDFQRIIEHAETDLTQIGHTTLQNGQYVRSWEWHCSEVERGTEEWHDACDRSCEAAPERTFDRFDILEAFYVFAMLCHGGQFSREYAIFGRLKRLAFEPRPSLRDRCDLSENGRAFFDHLRGKQDAAA